MMKTIAAIVPPPPLPVVLNVGDPANLVVLVVVVEITAANGSSSDCCTCSSVWEICRCCLDACIDSGCSDEGMLECACVLLACAMDCE